MYIHSWWYLVSGLCTHAIHIVKIYCVQTATLSVLGNHAVDITHLATYWQVGHGSSKQTARGDQEYQCLTSHIWKGTYWLHLLHTLRVMCYMYCCASGCDCFDHCWGEACSIPWLQANKAAARLPGRQLQDHTYCHHHPCCYLLCRDP